MHPFAVSRTTTARIPLETKWYVINTANSAASGSWQPALVESNVFAEAIMLRPRNSWLHCKFESIPGFYFPMPTLLAIFKHIACVSGWWTPILNGVLRESWNLIEIWNVCVYFQCLTSIFVLDKIIDILLINEEWGFAMNLPRSIMLISWS